MSPTPRTRMMGASSGRCTLQSYSEMGCGWSGAGRPAEAASRPGVGYSDLRQLPRLDEVYEDVPLVLLQDREVPSFTDPHFVPGDLDLGARRAGRTQRHLHVLHRLSSFLVNAERRNALVEEMTEALSAYVDHGQLIFPAGVHVVTADA